jgi:preprotein translocase subunit SecE
MARIQKKKTVSKKKIDQKVVSSDSTGSDIDAVKAKSGMNGPGLSTAVTGAEKKKKIFSVNKPSGPDQSAVMKLVEKYFGSWIQFFREVKVELTKVTWPSKKQTMGSTVVVIVFVFVIAFFLGIVDMGLSNLIRLVL